MPHYVTAQLDTVSTIMDYLFFLLAAFLVAVIIAMVINNLHIRRAGLAEAKHQQLTWLMERLEKYVSYHLRSSEKPHRQQSDTQAGVEFVDCERVLALCGVVLPPPLTQLQWNEIRAQVGPVRYQKSSERTGAHPRVDAILKALLPPNSPFQVINEGEFADINKIVTKCDFNVVERSADPPNLLQQISGVLVPLKVNSFGEHLLAVQQSLGFGASTLLDRAELLGEDVLTATQHIVCIGTDGVSLGMGVIKIVRGDLRIYSTGRTKIPLWTKNGSPSEETLGIRILRALLQCELSELGADKPKRVLRPAPNVRVQISEVLGRGSFCCAYRCVLVNDDGTGNASFVMKAPKLGSPHTIQEHVAMIEKEAKVLRRFAGQDAILPTLLPTAWAVSTSANGPYLCLARVGIPLPIFAQGQTRERRVGLFKKLRLDLENSLGAAHRLGYFHADLRPDNVVFENRVFKAIDWGLAVAVGDNMHNKRGGLPFFAGELVRAAVNDTPVRFVLQYDLESVLYVAYAYVRGDNQLTVPWADVAGEDMLRERQVALSLPMQNW